jgi:hypothetical protein
MRPGSAKLQAPEKVIGVFRKLPAIAEKGATK